MRLSAKQRPSNGSPDAPRTHRAGRRRRERGAAALELAMLIPMLTLILMGMFDYGKHLYINVMAVEAVRQGARALAKTAVTNCASAAPVAAAKAAAESSTGITAAYMNQTTFGSGTVVTVTATCLTAPIDPTWQLTLTVDYPPFLGFLTAKNLLPKTGTKARVTSTLFVRGK